MKAQTFVMPLAVLGAIGLVYALLKRSSPNTVILGTSGGVNPATVGGAPQPTQSQINTQATTPVQPGTVQTLPSTLQSGVPDWAGQSQGVLNADDSYRTDRASLAPSASTPASYAPIQGVVSNVMPQPASQPTASGTGYVASNAPVTDTGKNGCGCGSKECSSCVPKCSTAKSRWSDGRGGCLAMDRKRQIKQASRVNPQIWDQLRYQLQTSGCYDFFQGFQSEVYFMQRNSPQTDGFTEPAAPALGYVGNSMYN